MLESVQSPKTMGKDSAVTATNSKKWITFEVGFWLALILCLIPLTLKILSKFSVASVFDDSFMFGRYAGNVINYKQIVWNWGGQSPTYGLTSNLYLLIVLPFRLVLGDRPGIVAITPSLFCGFLFLILLFILLNFFTSTNYFLRRGLLLVLFFSFAIPTSYVEYHFTDGMDTTFDLCYIAIYIIICCWTVRTKSKTSIFVMSAAGALIFAARPEAMLYSILVPLALALFGPVATQRRTGWYVLGLTMLFTALELAFNWWYFGTALPLSFYAKATDLYGSSIYQTYKDFASEQFGYFFGTYWYLFVLIGLNIVVGCFNKFHDVEALDKGFILASTLFLIYHYYFVLPIMGYAERFFYPVLPVLAFVGCRGANTLIKKFAEWFPQLLESLSKLQKRFKLKMVGSSLGLLALLLFTLPSVQYGSSQLEQTIKDNNFAHFKVGESYLRYLATERWFRLDLFSLLPDDLVIATTEVGYPAAMNPKKSIIDMAGLNDSDFALHSFSADFFFKKYRPDIIFMPHPDYKLMYAQLLSNSYFLEHYVYYPPSQIGTSLFGVAIWKDSKYYQQMQSIVATHN